jgi:two-component system, NarL family, response regulator
MPTQLSRIRLMIVDDHPIVLDGLRTMASLQPDMEVVCDAHTVAAAIEQYQQHLPDVCLVDLRLPDGSGVDLIRTIREKNPRAQFVVLTTHDGDEYIQKAITAGAKGYVLKDMDRDQLLAAIRAVAAGESLIPEAVAARLVSRITSPDITDRELDVLRLMAKGHGNKTIASELGIGEGTVRSHMVNLFRKLDVNDRTSAVLTAAKRGLIQLG